MQLVTGDRVVVLAERLAAATATNHVDWQLDGDDKFLWKRAEGKVSIGSRDADGEPPYELAVFNGDDVKVDQLTSQLLANDQPAPWNEPLAELYRSARRKAYRADELLDTLINLLPKTRREQPASVER
jgi:hypothetical protein